MEIVINETARVKKNPFFFRENQKLEKKQKERKKEKARYQKSEFYQNRAKQLMRLREERFCIRSQTNSRFIGGPLIFSWSH